MTVFKWSTTANTNATVDSTINWRENQSPSSVNDSARAMMAAIAKWRNDMSGNLVTAGSSTAYTLTTNQVFTSLSDGLAVAARLNAANGAAPTLNVDSTGARALATVYGTAVGSGVLRSGAVYVFVYDSTDDKWIVQGNPNSDFPSGTKVLFRQTAAPVGWTKDTTYTNAALRVTSGSITEQATAGKEFSTLFASRTISEANLPAHTHAAGTLATASDGAHTHSYTNPQVGSNGTSAGGGTSQANVTTNGGTTTSNGAHTHTITGSTASVGSGTAMAFDVNFVDVIIATRD